MNIEHTCVICVVLKLFTFSKQMDFFFYTIFTFYKKKKLLLNKILFELLGSSVAELSRSKVKHVFQIICCAISPPNYKNRYFRRFFVLEFIYYQVT